MIKQIPYTSKHTLENNQNINEQLPILIRLGLSNTQIAKELKIGLAMVELYRARLNYPSATIIRLLNENPIFEEEFFKLYSQNSMSNLIKILQQHPLFLKKKMCQRRLGEIRNFYKLEHKMFENKYESDYDRIRGYMIRSTKCTSQRRNIPFNLKYSDFELPTYCPLLGIKLTYLTESNGNCPTHASLDRVNNSIGYEKGNVLVISRLANQMKSEASLNMLETFAINSLKLVNYYKNQDALGNITDVFGSFTPKLSLDS